MDTLTFQYDAYFPFSLVLDTSPACPSLCVTVPTGDRTNGEAVLEILLHVNSTSSEGGSCLLAMLPRPCEDPRYPVCRGEINVEHLHSEALFPSHDFTKGCGRRLDFMAFSVQDKLDLSQPCLGVGGKP